MYFVKNGLASLLPSVAHFVNVAWNVNALPGTALRDINDLVERGILVRDGAGGRSTSYSLRAVQ